MAGRFHELFPDSDKFLLDGARHYVQVDEPDEVSRLILSATSADAPVPYDRRYPHWRYD
jgi:pimeloyl-ACP methyl ester carboxylesterase